MFLWGTGENCHRIILKYSSLVSLLESFDGHHVGFYMLCGKCVGILLCYSVLMLP